MVSKLVFSFLSQIYFVERGITPLLIVTNEMVECPGYKKAKERHPLGPGHKSIYLTNSSCSP